MRYYLELYKLFNSPDIIRFIKVKRLEWAGQLIRASENRMIIEYLIPNQKEIGKWEDQD
jgi:hypothetical protein